MGGGWGVLRGGVKGGVDAVVGDGDVVGWDGPVADEFLLGEFGDGEEVVCAAGRGSDEVAVDGEVVWWVALGETDVGEVVDHEDDGDGHGVESGPVDGVVEVGAEFF